MFQSVCRSDKVIRYRVSFNLTEAINVLIYPEKTVVNDFYYFLEIKYFKHVGKKIIKSTSDFVYVLYSQIGHDSFLCQS